MTTATTLAEFHDAVDKARQLDRDAQLAQYGKILSDLEDRIIAVDSLLKELKSVADLLTTKLIPDLMAGMCLDRARLSGIGEIKMCVDLYCSIPAAAREEAKQWLSSHGFGDLITETVNASTLRAWAKEQLLNGEEIPDDLFRIFPVTKVKLTRTR